MQTLSQGTERHKDLFTEILADLFSPKGILERNDPKVRLLEGLDQRVSVLCGQIPHEICAKENGVTFVYDLTKGQKTGSFLDQRENRPPIRIGRCARLLQLSRRICHHRGRMLQSCRSGRPSAGRHRSWPPKPGAELHFQHDVPRRKYVRRTQRI
jgi:23S rRNA (cytosine1962-C5)-methyltransferase